MGYPLYSNKPEVLSFRQSVEPESSSFIYLKTLDAGSRTSGMTKKVPKVRGVFQKRGTEVDLREDFIITAELSRKR